MADYIDGEDLDVRSNPGTANNNERSGDRDLYWSWLVRQPTSPSRRLRSCDFDTLPDAPPSIVCHKCGISVIWVEVTRQQGYKATWYTQNHAKKLGVEAYLIRHSGQWGSRLDGNDRQPSPTFEVTRLRDGKAQTFIGEQEFIKWLERKFESHFDRCRLLP